MTRLFKLRKNESGAAAIEFAIAVPVLVSFIYGFFTVGVLYEANAGMQHALGEASRMATLYVPANDGPPSASDVEAKLTSSDFGLSGGTFTWTVDTSEEASGYWTITVNHSRQIDFLFMPARTVSLSRSKRVWIAS